MKYFSLISIIILSLSFSLSCKDEKDISNNELQFKDQFFFPFGFKIDNNDLECNYYFTEDANDVLEFFSEVIKNESYPIEMLREFINQQMSIKLSTDDQKIQKINNISTKISDVTNYDNVQYFVVDMPGYYNAWMLLGNIYITELLLDVLENDDEIAFILSHELAHVVNHLPHQINLISSLYSRYNSGDISDKVNVAINKILDWTGKGDENEADVAALVIMSWAGYNAKKGIEVFNKTLDSRDPPTSFLSRVRDECDRSHPYSKDRFECLDNKIKKYGLFKENYQTGTVEDAEVIYNEAILYEYPSEFSKKNIKLLPKSIVNISYFYSHCEKSYHSSEKWALIITESGETGWIRDRYLKY